MLMTPICCSIIGFLIVIGKLNSELACLYTWWVVSCVCEYAHLCMHDYMCTSHCTKEDIQIIGQFFML
jgi:hypothetical protein